MLRRRKYFQGRSIRGGDVKDIAWLDAGRAGDDRRGLECRVHPQPGRCCLPGHAIEEVDERGEPIVGDSLLVLLNAHDEKVPFTLPALDNQLQWPRVIRHCRPCKRPGRRSEWGDGIRCRAVRSPSSRYPAYLARRSADAKAFTGVEPALLDLSKPVTVEG